MTRINKSLLGDCLMVNRLPFMHVASLALLSLCGCEPGSSPRTNEGLENESGKITLHVEGMAERLELF